MEASVLLTTYNHEKYIAQALDSVLMQEANFDYEIIVLEDYSTDATRQILMGYQERYPAKMRLRLAERNECSNKPFADEFQAAPSRYVAVLDGDDYWTSPKKLQKQVDFLETHPECSLCFHNALRIYDHKNRAPIPYNSAHQKRICNLQDIWQHNFIAGGTAMVRKDAVGGVPEWFYTSSYGDWPLYLLCAQYGKIGYIDEILSVYRVHSAGLWSSVNAIQKLEGLITFYETMNANLDFRFDHIVEPLASARRKELADLRSLVETAERILPPRAGVIVMTAAHEDLPPLNEHQVWAFPDRSPKQTQQHFASGPSGCAEAPWIQSNRVYEFLLYRAASDALLASVTVERTQTLVPSLAPTEKPGKDGAFIEASPNPVPADTKPGKTIIRWSTGDGSMGIVQVVVTDLQMRYPADQARAIKQLETLRTKGGEFLVVPRVAFTFFERYPELKQHLDHRYRSVEDNELCQIYDLHENAAES